jgi:hypothetical protein
VKKCPTCGNVVPAGQGHRGNKKYCNTTCFHNRNLGLDKDEVLDLLNRTDNIEVTAGLLGTYKQRIYAFIKRNGIRRIVKWKEGY